MGLERDRELNIAASSSMITKADSPFLRLLRRIRYGSIENFRLVDGEPILGSETEVCTEYKLSSIDQGVEVINDIDFLNKPQVRTMFNRFKEIRHGRVEILELRDGLPARIKMREKALS